MWFLFLGRSYIEHESDNFIVRMSESARERVGENDEKYSTSMENDAQNLQVIKYHYLNKNEWLIKKRKRKTIARRKRTKKESKCFRGHFRSV